MTPEELKRRLCGVIAFTPDDRVDLSVTPEDREEVRRVLAELGLLELLA
ncbi:MAG: hypothetical protein QOF33_477 [Thermomicrobiales bacterium]|nr:hypothetical protein [Thermomicrobiales bacterium]